MFRACKHWPANDTFLLAGHSISGVTSGQIGLGSKLQLTVGTVQ